MAAINENLDLVLKTAGPCFFMGMQVASLTTAYRIFTSRTTGQLSALPFMSLMTNSVLWTMYGALKDDYTVMVPNFTGSLVGILCIYVYHVNSSVEAYNNETRYFYVGAAAIITFGLACSYYNNYEMIGTLGVIMCVILMGSPLAVLRTVLTERNCNAMPFWTSLATCCNTFSWAMYGLIDAKDFMIFFPNFIGLALASVQMILFAVFGIPANDRFWLPTKSVVATSIISQTFKGPLIPVRTVYQPLSSDFPTVKTSYGSDRK